MVSQDWTQMAANKQIMSDHLLTWLGALLEAFLVYSLMPFSWALLVGHFSKLWAPSPIIRDQNFART